MKRRINPAERDSLRKEIETTQPEDISLGMMPLGPEDVRGIFTALKAFRTKFPEHAGELVARVGKMLKATPEEMEAGLTKRPRNDWRPAKPEVRGSGGPLSQARDRVEWGADAGVDVGKALRRSVAGDSPEKSQTPQGPKAKREEQAAAKATEKIITRVKAAVKAA